MQNFEYHTELATHIKIMAASGETGSVSEWNAFLHELNTALDRHMEVIYYASQPKMIQCPSCYGEGRWETECCNGSSGCSCQGGLVDMGRCNVCQGKG